MDFQFMQLVFLVSVPMLHGRDLELLDADLVARKAVEVATALIRESVKVELDRLIDGGV